MNIYVYIHSLFYPVVVIVVFSCQEHRCDTLPRYLNLGARYLNLLKEIAKIKTNSYYYHGHYKKFTDG